MNEQDQESQINVESNFTETPPRDSPQDLPVDNSEEELSENTTTPQLRPEDTDNTIQQPEIVEIRNVGAEQAEVIQSWDTAVDKLLILSTKMERAADAMSSATEKIPEFVQAANLMTKALNLVSTKIDSLTRATESIQDSQRAHRNSEMQQTRSQTP
ncbi:uncharacterized protein LOC111643937 [Copidosoma floridanum]|uniref:uncharacterized protein LOC111643568 n=1 Tax=Copidosoma floridanum TaxID=29053 RepID=UPI000C6F775C|nr:uncharacterized protein LOC111643568 [Copidosoma floridanum]XP_023248068.1 uncharacterized protein LOC111643937 [Copidosoma floridanum]